MDRRSFLIGAAPALIATPAAAQRLADARSPHDRIEAAMSELCAALEELYPGCTITSSTSLRGGLGALAIGAYPLRGYRVRSFFCDDPEGWSPAARL